MKELSDALDYNSKLLFSQFREDWQRKHLGAGILGIGEGSRFVREIGKCWLQVERMRVIDLCRNPVVTQELLQSITLSGADRELVVNVDRFRWSQRRIDMGINAILHKKLPIAIRIMTPTR